MSTVVGRPVGILGTGICIPDRVMTNYDLAEIVETSHEWIMERSGISSRHIVSAGESNASLTAEASRNAMNDAGITPDEVDMVIVGTNSPDTLLPGVGPTVQHLIGAGRAGGMDIQAGCPGALYGMVTAAGGIASGIWDKVIVSGSEALSRLLDWSHRSTCVLFGDGAGACVMGEWRPGMMKVTHVDLMADGSKHELISLPGGLAAEPATEETVRRGRHFLKMDGAEVFKFVNRKIPSYIENFCSSCGITTKDIDCWIFHQANIRILEGISRRLSIPMERLVINLDKYGNTSAASIMIGLHEARAEGRIQAGQRTLVSSFGAGMTYGALLIES